MSKSDSLPFIPNKIEQSRRRQSNGIFCVETRRSSTRNDGKRPDARKIGTQKLLPRIRARHHGTCGHINKLDSLIIHNHNLHKIIKTGEKKGHTSHI